MKAKRALAGLSISGIMAAGLIFGTASTAQATAAHCRDYLRNQGYIVGTGVTNACAMGTAGGIFQDACEAALRNMGVGNHHAYVACFYAAND